MALILPTRRGERWDTQWRRSVVVSSPTPSELAEYSTGRGGAPVSILLTNILIGYLANPVRRPSPVRSLVEMTPALHIVGPVHHAQRPNRCYRRQYRLEGVF